MYKQYVNANVYVVGLDISCGATKIAKKYLDDVIVSDVESLPLKNDVADTIICVAVLEHLINPDRCLQEIFRVSKKVHMPYYKCQTMILFY